MGSTLQSDQKEKLIQQIVKLANINNIELSNYVSGENLNLRLVVDDLLEKNIINESVHTQLYKIM